LLYAVFCALQDCVDSFLVHCSSFHLRRFSSQLCLHARGATLFICLPCYIVYTFTTTTVLRPFFWDHPGEPVPEQNFWTLWCKGRLTEADTPAIQLGATPSGLTSAHLHHPPYFLQAGCPSYHPTNSVKPAYTFGSDYKSSMSVHI